MMVLNLRKLLKRRRMIGMVPVLWMTSKLIGSRVSRRRMSRTIHRLRNRSKLEAAKV